MLSWQMVSDTELWSSFFSEVLHYSFHGKLLGVAQWRQYCCFKIYADIVTYYFHEAFKAKIVFCFMLEQPLEKRVRVLIIT